MCRINCSRRDLVKLAGASVFLVAGPALPVLAETSSIRLEGGRLKLKRAADGNIIRPGERVLAGAGGAVVRSRDQLFYMDEGTDAEFDADQDGRITAISVVKGGILSLFGPKTGKGHENHQRECFGEHPRHHHLFRLAGRARADLCMLLLRPSRPCEQ